MSHHLVATRPNCIKENVSLKDFNTFRFSAKARYFALIQTLDELVEALKWANQVSLPVKMLGEGSNLLITKDINALILVNRLSGLTLQDRATDVLLTVAAGENWHKIVTYAVNNNFGGLENLALIPGTVGASPVQNIGAYGVEVGDVIDAVEVLDRHSLQSKWLTSQECSFTYRDSNFKSKWQQKYLITSVRFRLTKTHNLKIDYAGLKSNLPSNPTIQDVYHAVCKVRTEKLPDPRYIGNAGSFFKNPIVEQSHYETLLKQYPNLVAFNIGANWKLAAGWLIDQAGWKGYRLGDVGVFEKQALCLVNHSSDNGTDLLQLEEQIKNSVFEKYGVELEREPILLPQDIK